MSKETRNFIDAFRAILADELFTWAEAYWQANDPEGDGVYTEMNTEEVEKVNFTAGKEIGAIIKRELQKSKRSTLSNDFDQEIAIYVDSIMDGIEYGLHSF